MWPPSEFCGSKSDQILKSSFTLWMGFVRDGDMAVLDRAL